MPFVRHKGVLARVGGKLVRALRGVCCDCIPKCLAGKCGAVVGSCCVPGLGCVPSGPLGCAALNGRYYANYSCEIGACCIQGACVNLNMCECLDRGGKFQGKSVDCDFDKPCDTVCGCTTEDLSADLDTTGTKAKDTSVPESVTVRINNIATPSDGGFAAGEGALLPLFIAKIAGLGGMDVTLDRKAIGRNGNGTAVTADYWVDVPGDVGSIRFSVSLACNPCQFAQANACVSVASSPDFRWTLSPTRYIRDIAFRWTDTGDTANLPAPTVSLDCNSPGSGVYGAGAADQDGNAQVAVCCAAGGGVYPFYYWGATITVTKQ